MCYIFDGFVPSDDLDCLKRLGDEWCREITYVPIFHPDNADEIERQGYGGDAVKVKVRIEVLEEEPQEEAPEES